MYIFLCCVRCRRHGRIVGVYKAKDNLVSVGICLLLRFTMTHVLANWAFVRVRGVICLAVNL